MLYLTLNFDGWEEMKKFHPNVEGTHIFFKSEQILDQKT